MTAFFALRSADPRWWLILPRTPSARDHVLHHFRPGKVAPRAWVFGVAPGTVRMRLMRVRGRLCGATGQDDDEREHRR